MGAGDVAVVPRRPWGLLAHRDFRLLCLGETTSSLGSTVTTVVLPLTAVTLLGARTRSSWGCSTRPPGCRGW
jgi:hypothetical protein